MAKLYFRYSPMNSGKSIHLLQTAQNYKERGMPVLLMTSSKDVRNGEGVISSRLGLSEPAYPISNVKDLVPVEMALQTSNLCAIFVDESQFLSSDIVDKLGSLVDTYDVPIFCYGLKTDYTSALFEGSARLFAIADSITELKSICKCGRKAIFNARIIESDEQIVLGGEETYTTMCRKCFVEHSK